MGRCTKGLLVDLELAGQRTSVGVTVLDIGREVSVCVKAQDPMFSIGLPWCGLCI